MTAGDGGRADRAAFLARVASHGRVAGSALFLVNGALIANVLPRLPLIKDTLGLTNAEVGAAVAAMPVGGLLAGGFAGVLIHRFGSGRLGAASGVLSGLLLVGLALAPSWAALAGVFLVLGALDAVMDAAQNAHSVEVQRLYTRSVLHGFHGWWSAGTMIGGIAAALAAAAAVPVVVHFAVAGAAIVVASLLTSRWILPPPSALPEIVPAPGDPDEAEEIHVRNLPRLLWILLPISIVGILGVMLEDSASTWSSLYLVNVLGMSAGLGAAGFVLYTVAMTAGRLTNDRWIDRFGDIGVSRAGGVFAATGLGVVALSGPLEVAPLAYLGFFLVGVGASSQFPVMVTAAGLQTQIPPGHAIALVSWMARVGLMVAPAAVGVAADAFGLSAAFLIPMTAAIVVTAFVPRLVPMLKGRRGHTTAPL